MTTWMMLIVLVVITILLTLIIARHYFNFTAVEDPAEDISQEQYDRDFLLTHRSETVGAKEKGSAKKFDERKIRDIVKAILDIRKFEINLYWRRATYFWAFIALTYAAFGTLVVEKHVQCGSMACQSAGIYVQPATIDSSTLTWFVTCFGLFLSVAWHLVNKGSKYWQENWENHLDLLEDEYIGPLYKTIVSRPDRDSREIFGHLQDLINGPAPFSVSKVNASLSFFNVLVWVYISIRLFLAEQQVRIDLIIESEWMMAVTVIVILLMILISTTNRTNRPRLRATKREVNIYPEKLRGDREQ